MLYKYVNFAAPQQVYNYPSYRKESLCHIVIHRVTCNNPIANKLGCYSLFEGPDEIILDDLGGGLG